MNYLGAVGVSVCSGSRVWAGGAEPSSGIPGRAALVGRGTDMSMLLSGFGKLCHAAVVLAGRLSSNPHTLPGTDGLELSTDLPLPLHPPF